MGLSCFKLELGPSIVAYRPSSPFVLVSASLGAVQFCLGLGIVEFRGGSRNGSGKIDCFGPRLRGSHSGFLLRRLSISEIRAMEAGRICCQRDKGVRV